MSTLSVDDQFTNWWDHELPPEFYELSKFDIAAAAWHEAWKRCAENEINPERSDYIVTRLRELSDGIAEFCPSSYIEDMDQIVELFVTKKGVQ